MMVKSQAALAVWGFFILLRYKLRWEVRLMLEKAVKSIGTLDSDAMKKAQERLDNLTKPRGSLGMLEWLAAKVAGITGSPRPKLEKKVAVVMAADHGVVAEGVSAFPQEVTPQMVVNFLKGGAAINVLSRHVGAEVVCVDVGVAVDVDVPGLLVKKVKYGTDNFVNGPAMTKEEAIKALEMGIETAWDLHSAGFNLFAIGEMGIGNTTASSAIVAFYSGRPLDEVVGRGSGIKDDRLQLKKKVIERGIEKNSPNADDPIDVLSKIGGLEIAGMAGCILGAASRRVPVVIDGFISSAAALVASKLEPKSVEYMIGSHLSQEPGHQIALDLIGLRPMMHLDMRLGEGTGAVLAFNLIEAALKILDEMATFDEAGVATEIM
jgi:nicotinate-nucleotide--dimethylbenzimidazole phosphoribosyltransferase